MRILLAASLLIACVPTSAQAENIFGLTNLQQIVTFDSDTRVVTNTVSPAGFGIIGESLLGIDVRPNTGELYGISNQDNIYVIDPVTGTSTQIGSTLSPAPGGFYQAIDFNPTVDRIRVLSSDDTNLRVHPDTGAVIQDGTLTFSAGDPNEGENAFIVNGAYTNSFPGSTATTLYDIDATNNALLTQTPANDGTLQTVGELGFDIASFAGFTGFDISGTSGSAFLVGNSLLGGGLTSGSLYQVNLGTGQATLLGAVTGFGGSFRDIAVAAPTAVPEPTSLILGVISLVSLGLFWKRYHNPVSQS